MPQIYEVTRRSLPSVVNEGVGQQARCGRYGERLTRILIPPPAALCDEGTYFKAINGTVETGISAAITAAFSSTAAFLLMTSAASGNLRIYPHYFRMIPRTVPASATRMEGVVAIDSQARFSSGGTQITTLPNANMDSSFTSVLTRVQVGAVVLNAESGSIRRLSRFQGRSAIPVAFEEFVFLFNQMDHDFNTLGGATAGRQVVNCGPVILGPGSHSMSLHLWWPGNAVTAGVWEFELAWWER